MYGFILDSTVILKRRSVGMIQVYIKPANIASFMVDILLTAMISDLNQAIDEEEGMQLLRLGSFSRSMGRH